MTEVLQALTSAPLHVTPRLQYQVAMPQPKTHLFEVCLTVQDWRSPVLHLKMPVWTPGSYLVREYARHLQQFSVYAATEEPLRWQKLAKHHWQIETADYSEIKICYQIFAHDLSVRTNHLDASHGYFNPAALCFYIPGLEQLPLAVTIMPPAPNWRVTTCLPTVPGQENTFQAENFDQLVDSPFEIGTHTLYDFEVAGKPHQLAIWGEGNLQPHRVIQDIQKLIQVEADLFGGLPYDRYLFLLHLSQQGNGGLEHKNGCSLNYPRFGFRATEPYNRFMTLVAHEFFHLWNVKRIRPQALETFDYERENYTPSLWFSEGTTSYYDQIMPWRAGIYDTQTYLKLVSESITRLQTTPGRRIQPLAESSFDAWIKLYRPDANSRNCQISYYLKGELVSLLLDLLIRQHGQNQRSLDQVMVKMWQQFGQEEIGFTPEQLKAVIESVAETDLSNFWQRYIEDTEELPFNEYLQPFALELAAEVAPDSPPYLGLTVKAEPQSAAMIKTVDAGSPAQQAGINAGDELLAIANFRVGAEQLNERLKDYQPGDIVPITVFHQDQLSTHAVKLAAALPSQYQIRRRSQATPAELKNLRGWLGDLPEA